MKRHIASSLGLLLLVTPLSTCQEERPTPTRTEPAVGMQVAALSAPTPNDRSVDSAMCDDYRAIDDVLDAIIAGDLGRAGSSAWDLAIPPDATMIPESWQPWAEGIRRHAADIVVEDEPATAARHAAALLEQCGSCHTAAGATVGLQEAPPPSEASGATPRMMVHAWAAERMAEGLLVPSESRWVAGAEALATAPLLPESVVDRDEPWLGDAAELAKQVGVTAMAARNATTLTERRHAYAAYLGTCVECHTLFRAGTSHAQR